MDRGRSPRSSIPRPTATRSSSSSSAVWSWHSSWHPGASSARARRPARRSSSSPRCAGVGRRASTWSRQGPPRRSSRRCSRSGTGSDEPLRPAPAPGRRRVLSRSSPQPESSRVARSATTSPRTGLPGDISLMARRSIRRARAARSSWGRVSSSTSRSSPSPSSLWRCSRSSPRPGSGPPLSWCSPSRWVSGSCACSLRASGPGRRRRTRSISRSSRK